MTRRTWGAIAELAYLSVLLAAVVYVLRLPCS